MTEKLQDARADDRQLWFEPDFRVLDVAETAANAGVGTDGGIGFPDCTLS